MRFTGAPGDAIESRAGLFSIVTLTRCNSDSDGAVIVSSPLSSLTILGGPSSLSHMSVASETIDAMTEVADLRRAATHVLAAWQRVDSPAEFIDDSLMPLLRETMAELGAAVEAVTITAVPAA